MRKSKTSWEKIDSMSNEELTQNAMSDPDNTLLDDSFFANTKFVELPIRKSQINIRIDVDMLDLFKRQDSKYQTHIDAVLKAYNNANL
jgi:uncharacterized protein (DUF4415 family)